MKIVEHPPGGLRVQTILAAPVGESDTFAYDHRGNIRILQLLPRPCRPCRSLPRTIPRGLQTKRVDPRQPGKPPGNRTGPAIGPLTGDAGRVDQRGSRFREQHQMPEFPPRSRMDGTLQGNGAHVPTPTVRTVVAYLIGRLIHRVGTTIFGVLFHKPVERVFYSRVRVVDVVIMTQHFVVMLAGFPVYVDHVKRYFPRVFTPTGSSGFPQKSPHGHVHLRERVPDDVQTVCRRQCVALGSPPKVAHTLVA